MTLHQHEHSKYVYIRVRIDGTNVVLRHEPDSWREDPLGGFKDRLQNDQLQLFTSESGKDIWLRPSRISFYTLPFGT